MSKLAEAKQLMIDNGRTIGVLEDGTGCLCPLGALALAYYGDAHAVHVDEDGNDWDLAYSPDNPDHDKDIAALARVIRSREDRLTSIFDTGVIFRYNDTYANSDEEVLSLFDEAMAS